MRLHRWLWIIGLVLLLHNAYLLMQGLMKYDLTAADFSTFYVAGKLLKSGAGSQLYNLAAQAQMHLNARYQQVPLPFNHAAYEAILFLPLALFKYLTSYYAWLIINLSLLLAIAARLRPWVHSIGFSVPLIAVLGVAFWPNVMVLLQGQDSILLALIVTEAYVQLKSGKDSLAGVILALGLFKFHLILPIAACLVLNQQWKFLRSMAAAGVMLIAASVAIIGPHGIVQYLNLLSSLGQMPLARYTQPSQMPNLRGLIATVFASAPSVAPILIFASSIILFSAVLRVLPGRDRGLRFDVFFAAVTAMSFALSFNTYEHDMAVMFPGLVLLGNLLIKSGSRTWKLLCASAIALLFVSPLYVSLFYHRSLYLMCVPIVTLTVIVAFAPTAEFATPSSECNAAVGAGQ